MRLSQGICLLSVDAVKQALYDELREKTKAPEAVCWAVAGRLGREVERICSESDRIQASGEVHIGLLW